MTFLTKWTMIAEEKITIADFSLYHTVFTSLQSFPRDFSHARKNVIVNKLKFDKHNSVVKLDVVKSIKEGEASPFNFMAHTSHFTKYLSLCLLLF